MTDFERRLRAAMAAAAEPAPAGLLDGIHRRHRRHVRRVATACVAVVAVGVAGTLVTRGLTRRPGWPGPGRHRPGRHRPGGQPAPAPSSTGTGAPGTVLRDCPSANGGTLGSTWKADSVHAGPVWFIYARPARPRPATGWPPGRPLPPWPSRSATATRPWSRRPPRSAGGSGSWPASTAAGLPTPCPREPGSHPGRLPGQPRGDHVPAKYAPGLTMFWEGFVTDLRGCIPLDVRASPGSHPVRVTIAATDGGCGP